MRTARIPHRYGGIMQLWLLTSLPRRWHDKSHYDIVHRFVIRAESEEQARQLACMSEAANTLRAADGEDWLDPSKTTCDPLDVDGAEDVILCDFHAG